MFFLWIIRFLYYGTFDSRHGIWKFLRLFKLPCHFFLVVLWNEFCSTIFLDLWIVWNNISFVSVILMVAKIKKKIGCQKILESYIGRVWKPRKPDIIFGLETGIFKSAFCCQFSHFFRFSQLLSYYWEIYIQFRSWLPVFTSQ